MDLFQTFVSMMGIAGSLLTAFSLGYMVGK